MKKNLKNLANYKYFENLIDAKNQRTIQFIYLVFTIIALIFFGIFAINPTLSTIAKLQKELSDNQFVDEQLQRKINNLSKLQTSYANLGPDIEMIDNSVPKTPQAPNLIAQIQSVAIAANVNVLSVQVQPVQLIEPGNSKKNGSFSFSIFVLGTQSNIYSMISSLLAMQRVISIDEITITKKNEESSSFQASIRGSGIFKP